MTLHKDQDPGFWRRGLSKRAVIMVVVVAVVVIVVALVIAALNGISFF